MNNNRRCSAHRGRAISGQVLGLHAAGLRGSTHQINTHDASRGGRVAHQGEPFDYCLICSYIYPANLEIKHKKTLAKKKVCVS